MSFFPAPSGNDDFKPAPEGQHAARCYRVIDKGTEHNPKWDTYQRKLMVSWEIYPSDGARMEDGRPFTIHETYTLATSQKAHLRKDLEQWFGRGLTDADFGPNGIKPRDLLGMTCFLQVIHNKDGEKTYANKKGIMGLPAEMEGGLPEQHNPSVFIWLDPREFNADKFKELGESLRGRIAKSPEWGELVKVRPEVAGLATAPAEQQPAAQQDNGWDQNAAANAPINEPPADHPINDQPPGF